MPTKLPRLNVTVTEEQHALLLELGGLQGRSAASYLREMLDAATPILRSTVPSLRLAAQEMTLSRQQAEEALREPLRVLRGLGIAQPDLLDGSTPAPQESAPGAHRSERSERGRAKRAREKAV